MQCDKAKNKGLQILDKVIKYSEAFGVGGLGYID